MPEDHVESGETDTTNLEARDATLLERQLQELWAKTLGIHRIGLHDDFFRLGGGSPQIDALLLQIEKTLGHRLPREILCTANTVAKMAKHIVASSPNRCLAPLQAAGSRPPLFCIHDLYGQVRIFHRLARYLGPDQPVYGLQLAGLDGTEAPLARFEDMAARYLSEIRTVQPAGPYHLGGYSMGGLIAYEMARQLRAAGEEVGLLGLLDTFPSHARQGMLWTEWFAQQGNRRGDSGLFPFAWYLGRGIRNIAQNLISRIWQRAFGLAWVLCETCLPAMPKLLQRPHAANLLALRTYRVRPYEGDAVLFLAEAFRNDHDNVIEDWKALIGGRLEILPIRGLHNEILKEPYVRELARTLSPRLCQGSGRTHGADGDAADLGARTVGYPPAFIPSA